MDILMHVNDYIVAAGTSGQSLATGIRNYIGPIVLLVIGIIAVTFLVKREITQFIIFLVIGIIVLILFYAPSWISNFAKGVSGQTGGGSWK